MKKEEMFKKIEEYLQKNPEATDIEIIKNCKLPIQIVILYKRLNQKK